MREVQIVVLLLFLPPFFQSLLSRNSHCVEKIRLCLPLLS
jgi:hypothetical protein